MKESRGRLFEGLETGIRDYLKVDDEHVKLSKLCHQGPAFRWRCRVAGRQPVVSRESKRHFTYPLHQTLDEHGVRGLGNNISVEVDQLRARYRKKASAREIIAWEFTWDPPTFAKVLTCSYIYMTTVGVLELDVINGIITFSTEGARRFLEISFFGLAR